MLQPGEDLQYVLNASIGSRSLLGLESLQIWVTDLDDDLLGLTVGSVIYVDRDAAGHGWFVDDSPLQDSEFDSDGRAVEGSAAARGIDLLSVIAHEVGHVLGFDHATPEDGLLEVGQRTVPDAELPRKPGRDFAGGARLQFMSSVASSELHHRSQDVVDDLITSLNDHSNRIVPVDLGMFGMVRKQVPWVYNNTSDADLSKLRAMIWDEEVGNFETAKDPQRATTAVSDDDADVLEFLEDVGILVGGNR